jgi:predicted Ser/Thr protein kinase
LLPEDWARAKPVLIKALQLPSADRVGFVQAKFRDEPRLCGELLAVLESYRTATRDGELAWNGSTTFRVLVPSLPRPDASEEQPLLVAGTSYGPYQVIRKLGAGGMGQVFLAEDVRLGRRVAVKSLAGKWLDSPTARQRLMREARSAAALTHPNIAAVYDVFDDGQHLLLVMEYVEGRPLSAVLDDGLIPLGHALRLTIQIAEAVGYAHDRGIIHCDLKPANVQLTLEGTAKVLDFGLARARFDPRDEVSAAEHGKLLGTPGYMAPERLVRGTLNASGDVYSLGVVLFELVARRHPYEERGPAQLLAVLGSAAPRISSIVPNVPAALDTIVDRALARDSTLRYQSAHELSRDLRSVLEAMVPSSPSWWPNPARAAAACAVALLILTLAGFVTSTFYNSPLGRTGGFEQESPFAWPLWGVRSLVAPVGYMVVFALIVMTARVAWQIAAAIRPLRRLCAPVLLRVAALQAALHSTPATTLASILLLIQILSAAVLFWRFEAIFVGLDSFITQRSPGQLEVFRPGNSGERNLFFTLLFAYVVLFGWAWYRLLRHFRSHNERDASGLVAAGITVAAISLFFGQILPYRTLIQSRAERVTYQSRLCYLVGQRADEAMLFCPLDPPPWKQIVKLDDPALKRAGVYESIFAGFDRDRQH